MPQLVRSARGQVGVRLLEVVVCRGVLAGIDFLTHHPAVEVLLSRHRCRVRADIDDVGLSGYFCMLRHVVDQHHGVRALCMFKVKVDALMLH